MTLAGLNATSVSALDVLAQSKILSISYYFTLNPSQCLIAYSNSILIEYGNLSTLGSLSAFKL